MCGLTAGYTRILGQLKKLRIKVCRNTIKNILKEHGFNLGPKRGYGTWPKVWRRRFGRRSRARDEFLKIHLKTLWACDFLTKEVWTLHGKVTYYVLLFIEVATRRVHIAGMTPNPKAEWMAQMARNTRMCWEELGKKPSYILKDWDTKFTAQFDAILEGVGGAVKRVSRRAPNMNPFCEAWIGSFKRECMDKFIVFGEAHLRHIAETYVAYHNSVRPHSGLDNGVVGDRKPEPEAVDEQAGVVCETWLGGLLRHYRRAA